VFKFALGARTKAKLKPQRTFEEAKIADEIARKARGFDQLDDRSQALLIHIHEIDEIATVRLKRASLRKNCRPAPQLPFRKKPRCVRNCKSGLPCCAAGRETEDQEVKLSQ